MMELIQILWDVFVLRDATKKGQMTWGVWVIAIGFVLLLYGTGVPAVVLYTKHPQYKPVLIAAIVFDGLLFVTFMVWGFKRWMKQQAAARGE